MMQRNNSAQIALNKKLRYERELYTRIAPIFQDIAAKAGGPFFNPGKYETNIEDELLAHYRKVYLEFGDDYRQAKKITLPLVVSIALNNSADDMFKRKAEKQARTITNTNHRQLNKIKKIAGEQILILQKANPSLTFVQLTTQLYQAALLRRVEYIAAYETQWSAEFSKAHEVSFIAKGAGVSFKAAKQDGNYKRWDAVGDDRMRDWHADVDSTIITIEEPFEVNGEYMMHPGDDTLGATASNLINCRCSVSYELWLPDEVDLETFPDLTETVQKWKDVGKGNPVSSDGTVLATWKDLTNTANAVKKAEAVAETLGPAAQERAQMLRKAFEVQKANFVEGVTARKDLAWFGNQAAKISKGEYLKVDLAALKQKIASGTPKFPVVKPVPKPAPTEPVIVKPYEPDSSDLEYVKPKHKIEYIEPVKPTSQSFLDDIASSLTSSSVTSQEISVETGKVAYATFKDVSSTKNTIQKAYQAAKASGIKENIEAMSQIISDFGQASANFKPGITPRKVFSSMGNVAGKILKASQNGEVYTASKKMGSVLGKKPAIVSKAPGGLAYQEITDQGYASYSKLPDETKNIIQKSAKVKTQEDPIWKARYDDAHRTYNLNNFELPVIDREEYSVLEAYKRTSSEINGYQRTKKLGYSSSKQKLDHQVKVLHDVIRRSAVVDDQIVWRGVNDYEVAMKMRQLNIGDKLPNASTTSTSTAKHVANNFSSGMLMEIELPAGTRALYVDPAIKVNGYHGSHQHEFEVILPSGGYFEVIEKTATRTKFRFVSPRTFSQIYASDVQITVPEEITITQEVASRIGLNAQEFYAMLMLGGFTTLAGELVDAYSTNK